MILKFYSIDASLETLRRELIIDETGTYAPQLGSYLIKKGFDVEIITMHHALFTNKLNLSGKEEFIEHFNKLRDEAKSEKNKKTLSHFIEFIDNGGKITSRIPCRGDIQEEIDGKRPLCALMTTNFIYSGKPVFNFHFNVVTGIDDIYVYVNDPLWDDRGGKNKYTLTEFLYGLYARAYGDLDNASLIKIKQVSKRR